MSVDQDQDTDQLGLATATASRIGNRFLLTVPDRLGLAVVASISMVVVLLDATALTLVVPAAEFLVGGESSNLFDNPVVQFATWYLELFGLNLTLTTTVVMIVLLLSLRAIGLLAQHWIQAVVKARYESDIKALTFRSVMAAAWPFFYKRKSSDLINAMVVEGRRCGQSYASLAQTIAAGLTVAAYLIVATIVAWQVSLASVAAVGVIFALLSVLIRRSRSLGVRMAAANVEMMSEASESLGGVKIVKSGAMELRAGRRFSGSADQMAVVDSLLGQNIGLLHGFTELSFVILLAGGLTFAVSVIGLAPSTTVLFALLFYRLSQQTKAFQSGLQSIGQLLSGLDAVKQILIESEAEREVTTGTTFSGLRDAIHFEDVDFSYGSELGLLKNTTLRIPAGTMVALVGPSGAGKTTIIDLTLGLLDPTSGAIEVDGIDLRTISKRSWRSSVSYVTQENLLFHDTVANNIRWSRPEATDAEIRIAARMAEADEFILELAEGYDTVVGERGVRISGGQRQRLALARAFVRNSPILILDEATSELDVETETKIQASLEELRGEVTMLVVAHRLSTVSSADLIYVLRDGEIAEGGTPAELAKRRGLYYRYTLTSVGNGDDDSDSNEGISSPEAPE